MLTIGVGNAWGDVVSGTAYDTKTPLPSGWTATTYDSDYAKLMKNDYVLSDVLCQDGITSIVAKIRKFGGPTDAQMTITIEWIDENSGDATTLGTIKRNSTDFGNVTLSSFSNTPTANTSGRIKLSCKGANSGKGSCVSQVKITYTSGSCDGYSIDYSNITGSGSVTGDASAEEGDKVTMTVTPESGYIVSSITGGYYDHEDPDSYLGEVSIDMSDYSFTMPAGDVYIYTTFVLDCDAPTVGAVTVTQPASSSTTHKLTFSCSSGVTSTGGCGITEHGYVYSTTNTNPTIEGTNCTKYKRGDAIAANTGYADYGPTSLACGTTYYVRAYAINASGTGYSSTAASNSTHSCLVDHFIDDMHSTTGYTGDGMAKEDNYSGDIPTISDKEELSSGTCTERHYKFVGWTTNEYRANPTGHIVELTGTATGTTYYAVWAAEVTPTP